MTTTTPSRFLTALRMAEAKRLLVDMKLTVTEVCDTVGYASLGTFTTQFSRHVGLSPSRYRNAVSLFGALQMRDVLSRFVPPAGTGPAVRGMIEGLDGEPAIAAVGMFESGIPQGLPAGGTVVSVPGEAAFFGLPDSSYHALAVGLDEQLSVEGLAARHRGPERLRRQQP